MLIFLHHVDVCHVSIAACMTQTVSDKDYLNNYWILVNIYTSMIGTAIGTTTKRPLPFFSVEINLGAVLPHDLRPSRCQDEMIVVWARDIYAER